MSGSAPKPPIQKPATIRVYRGSTPWTGLRVRVSGNTTESVCDDDGEARVYVQNADAHLEYFGEGQWRGSDLELSAGSLHVLNLPDNSSSRFPGESSLGVSPGLVDIGPRYEIVANAGRSGISDRYYARDRRTRGWVVVKVISDAFADDPDAKRRFLNEAMRFGNVDNPCVEAVIDAGAHQGRPFMVVERTDGLDLESYLDTGHMTIPEAALIGTKLAETLVCVHANNRTHGGIYPSNVLLIQGGGLKLINFGLARPLARGNPRRTRKRITMDYMAPEQEGERATSKEADIHQLGVTLFELFSWQLPFKTITGARSANQKVPPKLTELADVPEQIERIVTRCLAVRPSDCPSAHHVAAKLRPILQSFGEVPWPRFTSQGINVEIEGGPRETDVDIFDTLVEETRVDQPAAESLSSIDTPSLTATGPRLAAPSPATVRARDDERSQQAPPRPARPIRGATKATSAAEPAPADSPMDFDQVYEAGVEALLEHDFEAALDSFHRAAMLRPSDTRVMANLSRLRKMARKKGSS